MSDHLHSYRCILEGEIVLDSTTPHNTSGAFCDLFTATHPTVGKLALKRPRGKYDERLMAHVEIETKVWASLKHPRILQFLGIHRIGKDVYLVSAFAEKGSLPEFLERRPEVDRKRLVIEIAEGLSYLHLTGIIHGDLKGNNALISSGEHVLLCDFGLAKHVTSRTSTSLRGMGSIPWQSPELLQDSGRRTFQSDVYAFGILVYEVLSGKEPYAHHTGIVSIITGVLSGERPPKEPQLALDGSSYSQFWDEASKCWAEDPSSRPRVIDVLKRLDRQRAEALVTSQQSVLESSLAPPIDTPTSQPSSTPASSPQPFNEANRRDTLDWAHRIRIRMSILVNSQRPVGRISRKVIIMIVRNDLGPNTQKRWGPGYEYEPSYSSDDIKRCAELRTVCRAWRDAIETTPEFNRYILVTGWWRNVEYIRRCNRDGPVEFYLETADSTTWSKLSSRLGSLVLRVCSLNISPASYGPELSIRSNPFPMLRAVRIFGGSIRVTSTFALDLLEMVHANQDLTELMLHGVRGHSRHESPRLRIDHPGLQRVRLTQVSTFIQSHILQCLGLKNSAVLKIDGIQLEDLNGSDSAFGDLIRSLGQTRILAPFVEISENIVALSYAVTNGAFLDDARSSISETTSERSQLRTAALNWSDAVGMMRVLQGCGIKYVTLREGMEGTPADLLHAFDLVTTLQSRSKRPLDLLHQLGQPLQQGPESADEYPQFLCPNLTTLDLENAMTASSHWTLVHSMLCRMIQNRQTGTHQTNGPAKLQKIVLPSEWHAENVFCDPPFDGIEICSKQRDHLHVFRPIM